MQGLIKPNFFIVGAPKCGTTAMNDYLAQHPDIFMAKKELHFFGSDLKTRVKLSETNYLEYFSGAEGRKVAGEASVWYLFSKNAAQEIKSFAPDAKILIMLRNPVDVVHSLHSQHMVDGNEDIQDFETALSLDKDRKKGKHLPDSVDYFELPPYRDTVLFSEQVKRYLYVFGREKVRIILYEDFTGNTQKAVEDALAFLGVENRINIAYNVINPNKQIRSFYLHRLIKKPPQFLRSVARVIMPAKQIRHRLMNYFFKRNVVPAKREMMSKELYKRLKEDFAEDIMALSKIIDRDLSAWL